MRNKAVGGDHGIRGHLRRAATIAEWTRGKRDTTCFSLRRRRRSRFNDRALRHLRCSSFSDARLCHRGAPGLAPTLSMHQRLIGQAGPAGDAPSQPPPQIENTRQGLEKSMNEARPAVAYCFAHVRRQPTSPDDLNANAAFMRQRASQLTFAKEHGLQVIETIVDWSTYRASFTSREKFRYAVTVARSA